MSDPFPEGFGVGDILAGMARGKFPSLLQLVATVLFVLTICCAIAHAEPFDKPLKKVIVDLGRSPYLMPNDSQHIHLTCFYYPDFMVKEVDDPGWKGAFSITIISGLTEQPARCSRKHVLGEKKFHRFGDSYFAGVKGDLAFLVSSDNVNGGDLIGAFNVRTMAKMFEDFALLKRQQIDFVETADEPLTLKYWRVVDEACSIPKNGNACWIKFRKKLGLRHAPMPQCSDDNGAPSVVSYPVQATIYPTPSIKALDYPRKCWASE